MVAQKKVVRSSKKPKQPNIQCKVCKQMFSRSGRLALHMLKKHDIVWAKKKKLVPTPDNPRPHKCDSCEKAFIRRKHLLRHRISKHIGSKCAECDKKFVKLKEHLLIVHKKKLQLPYECHLCKQQYKSKQCIKTHMQAFHCKLNQTFRCPLCEEVMKCREVYRRHRNRHKYDRNRFNKRICEVCGKAILVSHFRKHEKTHSEGHLKCSFCEKLFKNQASVRLHERTHTQERPYECEICHSRFIDGSTLRVHRRNHTGESPFVCHLCGRRTKQAQNLASHYRHFHRNSEVTSKLIRFNARVFKRYDDGELERCIREDGDLTRLLAAGTIEYNKEMEAKNRDKELAEQRKFEEVQKLNGRARVIQKNVRSLRVPQPIEQINFDVVEGCVAQAAARNDQFTVKCESDEMDYAEVKFEPTLDVLGEVVDCDMSEFLATYDIKVEEPLHSNDIIHACEDDGINSNPRKSSHIKVEASPYEPIATPIIDNELNPLEETKNTKPVLPADKATIAKLSFCHICNVQYANPSVCATHMLQIHKIEQPDIPRPHQCLLCEKSYGRSSHLWRHYEKRHDSVPDRKIKKMITTMRKQKVTIEIVQESNESIPETVPNSIQVDGTEFDVTPETISKQDTELEPDGLAADRNTIAQLSYCHICDRKYANQGSCATHMLEVHQIKLPEIQRSFKCLLCVKSYTRSNHLARHYTSAHGNSDHNMKIQIKTDQTLGNTSMEIIQPNVESHCDPIALKNFKLEVAADGEEAKQSSYCEICDRDYSRRANLIIHMWDVHKIKITSSRTRPHKCVIETCRKSYKSRKNLLHHYRKEHGGNPERKEKEAKEKTSAIGNSTTGAEIESGTNECKVEIPDDVVTSKARSICFICDKRYANHWACAMHMMRVHKIKMPDLERPHSCDICHRSYVKRGHLARHLKTTHGIGVKRTANKASGFECYMCHESFKLDELLKKHTSKLHLPVERSSICPTCGLSTPRLGRHIIMAHSVKESKCNICQRVYSHPSRLTSHMKTHTRPAQCDLCPKRFASNGAMRQHRRYHTMEKLFACKFCGDRFIERSTCTQHERIHTGEKPYRCHICDARTIQAGNLKSHYRHFHKMIVRNVSMTKLVTDAEMVPITL